MKRFVRILIGLALLAAGVAISVLLYITRPKADEKSPDPKLDSVNVEPVRYITRSFEIPSQGIIEAARRSQLAAEVGGKVIETSEKFDAGMRVEAGDILLQIDPVNYEAALAQAKATEADAEAAHATELARAEQAKQDQQKLARNEQPNDLALRIPQLRSAEARVLSAKAAVEKAEKDRDRATIRAPYNAVIASTSTEVGSYLPPGTPVAEVFEADSYEVRLPLSIDEVQFLKSDEKGSPTGDVTITSTVAGTTESWTGKIVRTEGEVDRSTRSVYVVARVNQLSDNESARLQPGQFITASIPGREIPNVASVPFSAFLDLERVAIVGPDKRLLFRDVKVIFRDENSVYITSGPKEGEDLCLTELPRMIEGQEVEISETDLDESPAAEKPETSFKP